MKAKNSKFNKGKTKRRSKTPQEHMLKLLEIEPQVIIQGKRKQLVNELMIHLSSGAPHERKRFFQILSQLPKKQRERIKQNLSKKQALELQVANEYLPKVGIDPLSVAPEERVAVLARKLNRFVEDSQNMGEMERLGKIHLEVQEWLKSRGYWKIELA